MDYTLKHHLKPPTGWVNDPNGLVFFKGYYHIFYQAIPDCETPSKTMSWGHARTKDFITWEYLPLALKPENDYDIGGCFSGTAIVKDDKLYLYYASILDKKYDNGIPYQSISMATSTDGITFTKYENNPIINELPSDAEYDFRDPAIFTEGDKAYLVIASRKRPKAWLLLYTSDDMINWKYDGIMKEWEESLVSECPSFMKYGDKYLLSASVIQEKGNFFNIMYGDFDGHKFYSECESLLQLGPDQYAGQIFVDDKGRHILISWIPGWHFSQFAEKSLGCMSLPMEITVKDGKIYGYPVNEVQHLLKDSDPDLKVTEDGFIFKRKWRADVVHKGKINDIKVLRDNYIMEVFINGGEFVYAFVIC